LKGLDRDTVFSPLRPASGPSIVTPRNTRLLRASDLKGFREAVVALASNGSPLEARDRLVIVPTRAAAAQLAATLELRLPDRGRAQVLPVLVTPREIVGRCAERLPLERPALSAVERETLMSVSARATADGGCAPPFRLRPALVAEMLRFYDTLRSNRLDVQAFERIALGRLEPGVDLDRGAQRLVTQTRFLVAAFLDFERRSAEHGDDDHRLRSRLLAAPSARPYRHAIVAAEDYAADPHGLRDADWDLLARLPGLERLDVIVTDGTLAGPMHERMHALLPGIVEERLEASARSTPARVIPAGGDRLVFVARDREEEIAGFARRAKAAVRRGITTPGRVAMVVGQPLPYVYLTREVLASAGVPVETHHTLPLAGEPYAAVLDALFAAVTTGFSRASAVMLLRSPHLAFVRSGDRRDDASEGTESPVPAADLAALDRALVEHGCGECSSAADAPLAIESLLAEWSCADRQVSPGARRAGAALLDVVRELAPLRSLLPVAQHLAIAAAFIARHERLPEPDAPYRARHLRARAAILGELHALRDAYARFDTTPVTFDEAAALVRRRIELHTFADGASRADAPLSGVSADETASTALSPHALQGSRAGGVHLLDAGSARFGEFDVVQLAGVVDGEWPERPHRNVFYPPDLLRELGWPSAATRAGAARARFLDLLRLPSARVVVSSFALEDDSPVSPSVLAEEVGSPALGTIEEDEPSTRVFQHEALAYEPVDLGAVSSEAQAWARHRLDESLMARPRGITAGHEAASWSSSALERYQDCPFRFFAANVLRLEEPPEEGGTLSPRARGRFLHDVLHAFYEAWQQRGGGAITPATFDAARALLEEVAGERLGGLGRFDAAMERARIFGSAASPGIADVLFGMDAVRSGDVLERWLEVRLEGTFNLGDPAVSIPLNGVADRIDLLPGRRLRVIDYKSGTVPHPSRALQAGVYALCAAEILERRDGRPWAIEEASYAALSGRRRVVRVVAPGVDGRAALDATRARVVDALHGIRGGTFPPRPHDTAICRTCAYSSVCRKEYTADE
jgi:RecB family exonuclease